jgi:hypothetical protein
MVSESDKDRKYFMKKVVALLATVFLASPRISADGPDMPALVSFPAPWTSVFIVDLNRPYHLVNKQGDHLFILNKTAWHYFGCKNPDAVLDRAIEQGVNVLRVCLEGNFYYDEVHLDEWPWLGTRDKPDYNDFNTAYWDQVERRIKMAGERGIGFDLVIYGTLRPDANQIAEQKPYWSYTLKRLSKYANILTWEIANEYLQNEQFQDVAGWFFKENDQYHRPICTSDGTTDDAAWPDKPWVDLAINHSCTSSTPKHDLKDWYLAVARNTRSHGKPAFCNESGRENRHKNNDPIHRRKQAWLWCSAGGYWTWHSFDGCEGIDDVNYHAPGWQFTKPLVQFFRPIPFWKLAPNCTALTVKDPNIVSACLADSDRSLVVAYLCTRQTSQQVSNLSVSLRLPDGRYSITFLNPADLSVLSTQVHNSAGLKEMPLVLVPDFSDDVAIKITRLENAERTLMPGTR